jgi:chemotaxis protein MotB
MIKFGKKPKTDEDIDDSGTWLITYSDLVTLLLTFFVLLFSMATIDVQKYTEIAESLRSAFHHISSGESFDSNKGKDIIQIIEEKSSIDIDNKQYNTDPGMQEEENKKIEEDKKKEEERIIQAAEKIKAEKLKKVKTQIQDAIIKLELDEHVKVLEEEHMLILRIDSVILFDLGKADIKPSGKETLLKLGILFNELDSEILVQGHTDNLPIDTYLFPTNWELSTRRATNVVRFLIDNCSLEPSYLTATGNAEFKPIKPNNTPENRQKNRRIDIVIAK